MIFVKHAWLLAVIALLLLFQFHGLFEIRGIGLNFFVLAGALAAVTRVRQAYFWVAIGSAFMISAFYSMFWLTQVGVMLLLIGIARFVFRPITGTPLVDFLILVLAMHVVFTVALFLLFGVPVDFVHTATEVVYNLLGGALLWLCLQPKRFAEQYI